MAARRTKKPRTKAPARVPVGELSYDKESMRAESLARAQEERQLCTSIRPVQVAYYPDRKGPVLADGRHRVQAARDAGDKDIPAEITVYGPRGGVRARRKRGKVVLR